MRERLEKVPGVTLSFSQPIEQRVDELVSGVKAAIGIKIFGDDLGVLASKADKVAAVLRTVPGGGRRERGEGRRSRLSPD